MQNRSSHRRRIILFDGVCNMCNGWVKFVIQRDPEAMFSFASLQSAAGRQLLRQYRLTAETGSTLVLIEDGSCYVRSSAVLRICRRLTGPWKLAYGLIVVPKLIRDPIYRFVAARRYRWFGKTDVCMLPSPAIRSRFLELEDDL